MMIVARTNAIDARMEDEKVEDDDAGPYRDSRWHAQLPRRDDHLSVSLARSLLMTCRDVKDDSWDYHCGFHSRERKYRDGRAHVDPFETRPLSFHLLVVR
jgi:hypothetical protein